MKKWMVSGIEKEKYEVRLGHLFWQEVRECSKNNGKMSKGQRNQTFPQTEFGYHISNRSAVI